MQTTIYKARWILPVSSAPIENGALLVENGIIKNVGPAARVLPFRQRGTRLVDFEEAVLVPSWINAHAHLELSVLHNKITRFKHFVDWIEQLLALRQTKQQSEIMAASEKAARELRASGCALVGDITNGDLLAPLRLAPGLERRVFFEILGFQHHKADALFEQARKQAAQVNPGAQLAAHALYSTSPTLMKKIAAGSHPFTIHLAESPEESMLLLNGGGPLIPFLKKRGVWDEGWQIPGKSPAACLNDFGLLNKNSLLVHAVQVDNADVEIIKESGAAVCLCPRSNAHCAVGKAPLQKFLQKEIPLCLGTDSLASNIDLDMNNEIYYAYRNGQGLRPDMLLRMATLNGARILGQGAVLGSLQPSKKARFNVFKSKDAINKHPEEFVVSKSWSELKCF